MKTPQLANGCSYCKRDFNDLEARCYLYLVNPVGGYGKDEVLICEDCVLLPQNSVVAQRLCKTSGWTMERLAESGLGT